MGLTTILLYITLALVSVLVYFYKRHLSFWKYRGIPHDEPDILVGSLKGFRKNRNLHVILKEYYDKYKGSGPFVGFFFFQKPSAFILDLDLAKDVLIKDFNNFTDHGMFSNERDDPLSAHLFNLDGARWRNVRNKVSPTFTSGKMKLMFPSVVSIGEQLVIKFDQLLQKDPIVEVKDVLARYTVDVIGSCAFGLECNSLKNPTAEFRIMGDKALKTQRHNQLIDGLLFSFPEFCRKLGMRQIHEEVHQFYMRVVRDTFEYRQKNKTKRYDFMNLLMEQMNKADGLTLDQISAQAFVFLIAGFETSSTTLGFAMFELSLNQDIQSKLRDEINETIAKHDGKFTYECMSEMHYMVKVVKETLRKYSVVSNVFRKALNDYPTSDPKYTIPKGTMVLIPVDAIHRDPEIYPEPEKFDPERFSPEEIQKRHALSWLPFGEGPRNCVGLRFGLMQIYIGLAMMLKNYKFHYSDRTPNPLVIDAMSTLNGSKGGIHLRVERV